jgi:hypothetical protein
VNLTGVVSQYSTATPASGGYQLLPRDAADILTSTAIAINGDVEQIGVLCEKHRRNAERPVPIDVPLSDGVPDRDVIPHDLGGYDADR